MDDARRRWKRRVDVFRCIYSDVVAKDIVEAVKRRAFEEYNFDADQLRVIEYYADHRDTLIKTLSNKLVSNWTWDRIPAVEKAVLLEALSEKQILGTAKTIIIDQSLITIKHYGDPDATKYINAILDKVME